MLSFQDVFYPQSEMRPTCHPGDAVRARHASPTAARRAPCAGRRRRRVPAESDLPPLSAVFFTSTCLHGNKRLNEPPPPGDLYPSVPVPDPSDLGHVWSRYQPNPAPPAAAERQLIQIYNSNDILFSFCSHRGVLSELDSDQFCRIMSDPDRTWTSAERSGSD